MENLTCIPLQQSMACSKSAKNMVDVFSNVPDTVIDKILEKLPIRMAAQTSVLSKQWERSWLSLIRLSFDSDFHEEHKNEDGSCNWQESSRIISRILLRHNGLVHHFNLYVPDHAIGDQMNLNQWISFLSKNGVQTIRINNSDHAMYITSCIFRCSELVYLELANFSLNPPPTYFHGFTKLKHLELISINFSEQNIFCSLVEKCRMLVTLKLVECTGMDHVVIDTPRLETLILIGYFESLVFRNNVVSLTSISLDLTTMPEQITVETFDSINLLASSCKLESIKFDGYSCQFLAAGSGMRSRPPSVTFNHLDELYLGGLNLSEFAEFRYLLSMIKSCPNIKKLDISILPIPWEIKYDQPILELDYNYKLDHLYEVNIEGIIGSSEELRLVIYLLAISTVLKNVFFKSVNCHTESQLEMYYVLLESQRASSKARVLFL
ncbi:F-box/FBD/LRR-repeat protein At1g13570-like [Silene latifolia]|uniref:F-box/FBD/LRR-repeat protein At1g13570-like n=1 Tax=Silene latifolia TaxID=37657 RepID=UPI003D77B419